MNAALIGSIIYNYYYKDEENEMTEHKFTDDDVIKALECLSGAEIFCRECAFGCLEDHGFACKKNVANVALDLINRQKAEIERLKREAKIDESEIKCTRIHRDMARAEAIKEFVENLTQDIKSHRLEMNMNGLKGTHRTDEMTYETIIEYIDTLVKEMTEEIK